MRSPCVKCNDVENDKNVEPCVSCESRNLYAVEKGFILSAAEMELGKPSMQNQHQSRVKTNHCLYCDKIIGNSQITCNRTCSTKYKVNYPKNIQLARGTAFCGYCQTIKSVKLMNTDYMCLQCLNARRAQKKRDE